MKDLLETPEKLPQEVKDILKKYDSDELDYDDCDALVRDLGKVGYVCDYYL